MMSFGIDLILGRVLLPGEMRMVVQDVFTQSPGASSTINEVTLDPQQAVMPALSIEQQRTIIWFSFDARSGVESNEPDEGHHINYPSGYWVNDDALRIIEEKLRGPIQSLVPVTYASDIGSQRLALLLADAISKVSPVLVDMDWPEDADPFAIQEIRRLLATGDPNPIWQAWLDFKAQQEQPRTEE